MTTEVTRIARTGHRGPGASALVLGAFAVGLAATAVLSVGVGSVAVAPERVLAVVAHHLGVGATDPWWSASEDNIVWLLRAPRVLTGIAVGAALSVAGAVIQALVRNPLADPYLLGISSGATAGAAAHILFGLAAVTGATALAGSAFLGAVVAIVLVFAVARIGGRLVPSRLVFAGIAVGLALGALTNLMVFFADSRDGVRAVLFWTLGSLGQSRWDVLGPVWIVTAVSVVVFWAWSRRLDAMALGDDTARSLGTHPTRFRAAAALLVALLVATAVSVSGAIGFVGLVVPHLARLLVGGAHRVLLPTAALLGAVVLVWADTLARSVVAPAELPLGVLTALLGTPLLVVLVHRLSTA
ncbi:FecCD family ABC transporter permease [Cellulosimicrobium marinum]|uniref:FecCD family ABC transporter permease n=1 Tax=Cellulosimicrobium marinum TaxID=1638992 RepID=UPI001E3BFA46|nr:iron ABC transporter permease [Cellulosimicrobium marinum]MCB7135619.1 iron ABC transporter permease [Cellulosimicrobium marinum]